MCDICGICLDSLNSTCESETVLVCKHKFHEPCVEPWLANKGTCPTCRFRVREVESEDNDEMVEEFELLHHVMNFWQRRAHPPLPDMEMIVRQVQDEREERDRQRQTDTGLRLEEYASHVQIVGESDTEWMYVVDEQPGHSLKNDIALVQSQTEAGFLTCIYAMHRYENDIVNAILDVTGI